MTLATKNSINKNVAFEIEKSMIFLIPFSNCQPLLKICKVNGKNYTAVTREKQKIEPWKFQQRTTVQRLDYF
jgi:hypothetical protein